MGLLFRRLVTWFVGAETPAPAMHEDLDLLTVASHELRTPLTSVKAALHLLNTGDEQLTPRGKRLLQIAEVETDRLIRLTTEILDSARNEARELAINCDWISLADVMTHSCDGLTGLAEQSKVSLQFDRSAEFEVFADPVRLEQILTNILANAIRFSPENGTVVVKAQPDAFAHMVLEIKDEGPGLEASQQAQVFNTFKQAGSTAIGSGLGLSITKTLVERMGGTLGVRSEIGQGSVFYVSLRDWRKIIKASRSHKDAA